MKIEELTKLPDSVAAYAAALDNLIAVRKRPDADDPRPGRRTDMMEAGYRAREAREAVERAHGPAAVAAAEAAAELRDARKVLAAARIAKAAGVRIEPVQLSYMENAVAEAEARTEETEAAAHAVAEAMQARIRLETDHAPMLERTRSELADAARAVASAAALAQVALAGLARAEATYGKRLVEAQARLGAAGLDEGWRLDGTPYPSSASPLRINGEHWPCIQLVSVRALIEGVYELAEAVRPLVEREDAARPAGDSERAHA